jgi:hypothetical protein
MFSFGALAWPQSAGKVSSEVSGRTGHEAHVTPKSLGEARMRFWKPLSIVALALTMAATTLATADAGGRRYHRYHHSDHSGRNLALGLGIGLVTGAILYNATRPRYYNPGISYTYDEGYAEEVCYRGPKECHGRWNCWVNAYGNEVCEKQVSCRRPLICE